MVEGKEGSLSGFVRTYLSDTVAAHLKTCIHSGAFHGQLPGERRLAQELGISRPTVRLALALLAAEGVIERTNGRTTRMRVVGTSAASSANPTSGAGTAAKTSSGVRRSRPGRGGPGRRQDCAPSPEEHNEARSDRITEPV